MATYKYREEIVGKRFLSVSSQSKLKFTKINEWSWRSGFVRAVSHKDCKHPDLTILVEFDDTDWKSRDWIRLYLDDPFSVFLVENTLVWTPRSDASCARNFYWPSLTFKPLVDNPAFAETSLQPVEFLVDQELGFVDYGDLMQYQKQDDEYPPPFRDFPEVQKAIKQWNEYQDGQRILVTTPSVLVGYRVEVYRVEGTTQWYTAVIISYNDNTRELTLTDDTVLEEHNEDPCLVQMKLIGEGVVESILKGENLGITPRRRTCTTQQQQPQHINFQVHYCTRTRSHQPVFYNINHRLNTLPPPHRKSRNRQLTASATKSTPESSDQTDHSTPAEAAASSVPEKDSTQSRNSQQHHDVGGRRKKSGDTAHAAVGYRKDGRRKHNRQKRAAALNKIVADKKKAEKVECNLQCAKLDIKTESVTVKQEEEEENVKRSPIHSNGLDSPVKLPCKTEVAPKLLLSVKSVKEPAAKDRIKTPKQEKLASDHEIPPSSKLEWTVSAIGDSSGVNTSTTEYEDIEEHDKICCNSSNDKSPPTVTSVSTSVSVEVTVVNSVIKLETNTANDDTISSIGDDNFSKEVVAETSNVSASAIFIEKQEVGISPRPYDNEKNSESKCLLSLSEPELPDFFNVSKRLPEASASQDFVIEPPIVIKQLIDSIIANENLSIANRSLPESPVTSKNVLNCPVTGKSSESFVASKNSPRSPEENNCFQPSLTANESLPNSPVVYKTSPEHTVVSRSSPEPDLVVKPSSEHSIVDKSTPESLVVNRITAESFAVNINKPELSVINKSIPETSVINPNTFESPVFNRSSPEPSVVSKSSLVVSKSLPNSPKANINLPNSSVVSKSLPNSPIIRENLSESLSVDKSLYNSSESFAVDKYLPNSPIVNKNSFDIPLTTEITISSSFASSKSWSVTEPVNNNLLLATDVNEGSPPFTDVKEELSQAFDFRSILKSSSLQELCQRDFAVGPSKTGITTGLPNSSFSGVSLDRLKGLTSDIKENIIAPSVPKSGSILETFPKVFNLSASVKQEFPTPVNGTQNVRYNDAAFVNDSARVKRENDYGANSKYSPDCYDRALHDSHSVLKWKQESRVSTSSRSGQHLFNERKHSDRNVIVNAGHHKHSNYKSVSLSFGQSPGNVKNFGVVPRTESHHASSNSKSGSIFPGARVSGMSHLDKIERSIEKSSSSLHSGGASATNHKLQHVLSDHRTLNLRTPSESTVTKERSRSEERRNAGHLQLDRHDSVRVYRDPLLVNSGPGVRHVDCLHHGLMHPAGISHSAAAAAAAAVYPRVAALPQHSRNSAAPIPPSPLGPYSLSSHLLPPPHVSGAPAAAGAPPGSHMEQHAAAMHSQAYRHLMSQHPLIPPQYGGSTSSHVGMDLMWPQKYSPWMIAQYEEGIRIERERERVIVQERERNRMERDRREDMERTDREKVEREKMEKDRLERERVQKEQQRQDRERLDREERERVQREAVQQHFEESLRHMHKQPHHQKSVGWSPMSSLSLGKTQSGIGRSSPTVSQSLHPSDHDRDKVREKEKERISAMEARMRHDHERWLAAVQRNDPSVAHSSHAPNYSSVEPRSGSSQTKQEHYSMSRVSPHAVTTVGHHSSKPGIVPSPVSSPAVSTVPASQHKSETSFSLYGYQPFQHTYITHAQLKAREETKGSNNMQPMAAPGNKQSTPSTATKDKEVIYERPSTPGNNRTNTQIGPGNSTKQQLKLVHQGQERASPMYQPLVGSGGAFKPYEYSNNSPAPPAHQNSSSPTIAGRISTPHFLHSQQEQPQNLVKSDNKGSHDQSSGSIPNHQRYDSRDIRQTLSTPPTSIPSSYTPPYSNPKSTSPASNTNYSYNLIQQGLVPNPLYIAATHSGSSPALNTSATTSCSQQSKSACGSSPPISQHFPRATSGAGITSGTPVCRSNSISYPGSQNKGNQNYSLVGHIASQAIAVNPNRTCPQEAHAGGRLHVQGTSSNHRSPSPAHLYSSVGPGIHAGSLNSAHHSRGPSSSPRLSTSIGSSQIQTMQRMPSHSNQNTISISPSQPALSENQVLPLNLQGNSPIGKRKSVKEINHKKRQKTNEDNLLPPQLQPQIIHPTADVPVQQIGIPPNLVSNSCLSSSGPYLGGSILPNPSVPDGTPNQPLTKPESSTTVMSELHYSSTASSEGSSNVPAFIDSYRSFVTTSQESQTFAGKNKIPNKPAIENLGIETIEPPGRPSSNTNSAVQNIQSIPSIIVSQDGCDESRMTISPASSASSTLTSGSGTGGSINHTKLKKAWLQRHSENEDKKIPLETLKVDSPTKVTEAEDHKELLALIPSKVASNFIEDEQQILTVKTEVTLLNSPADKGSKIDDQQEEDSTSSASETEELKYVKRKLRINRKQGCSSPNIKKQKINSCAPEISIEEPQSLKKEKESSKKKSTPVEKEASLISKRRGRKTKGKNTTSEDESKKRPPKPVEKPSIAQLKKTGESFLQDGPCCEVAPRLPKCRECRMTPHQRSKKMPNIFCRFYAFRKLRYGKNGTILGAGFSEPSDATEDDLKLWLPPIESPPSDIEIETSKFLLTHVGDQFCDLVEMEREAQTLHMSESTTITWKRVVQGVREMCDVCETTLFNIHWVCHKCGFVVCIDCYKTRTNGCGKGEDSLAKDRDEFQWLLCTNRQPHEQGKLMITQIIASTALWDVSKMLHNVRRKWNIPTYCSCSARDGDQDGKHSTNGICKLMSAVTKCFSSDKESNQVNGVSESSRLSKKGKGSSVNGVKQDDGISGYSSESGGSPLSWLADVALNSSTKGKSGKSKNNVEDGDDDKSSDQSDQADGFVESDDDKNENFSTLRELLIRPMGKMGGKTSGADSSSQKTLTSTLDEVISCVIEQRVRKSDRNCKEKELLHFIRKHQMLRSGRELLPIRSCTITESSLLYPEIPHFWLGAGKILLLTDPYHLGNMQMFQEQWKRGQPVIVADVGQNLDESLWSPESFIRDFGDVKNDFLNCLCGTLVQNQPMKRFWEGFENLSKRMKDEDGKNMVLKLKDWPPNEEFSELLPARYQDLMKVLPLPHYTNRDGMFNMASRLPDCFVRPDLGPRMYNAYGLAPLCNKGSTNLHLDVSDTLNILAYVSNSSEENEASLKSDITRVIDESGCDSLMKKRSLEDCSKIGAIWHIYNARDADKIRDLLNKVAEEQGATCDPHHDPIHNQEWYLDGDLRERLFKEYTVKGYVIVQNVGDAIFIPAGSPHQVQNVKSCIKISEDFVSPESVAHSFFLTQEIRNLPDGPINHEDKLQIKNIIYHAVKDALALLQSCDPEDSKS